MTKKSDSAARQKIIEKRLELRNQLWGGEIENLKLWDIKKQKGFASVPRTLPHLARIMDRFAGKGTPVSWTYTSLLCNVFEHSFLEIKEKQRFAFEAGFSGERAVTTWISRMRKLKTLGFIEAKNGVYGEFSYVLIMNPFEAVKNLYKNPSDRDDLYNSLVGRMSEIGTVFLD